MHQSHVLASMCQIETIGSNINSLTYTMRGKRKLDTDLFEDWSGEAWVLEISSASWFFNQIDISS